MSRRLVAPIFGMVTLLALWESFVRLFDVRRFILLAPSTAVRYLWRFRSDYLSAAWVTVQHAAIGLLLALSVALLIGSVLVSNRFLETAAQPVLTLIQVVPWVAYISSVVVWLGSGTAPALFMVTVVCLPAFIFAAVDGMRSVEPSTLELMASVNASRSEVLRRVRLPSAAPTLFTTLRFNLGLALAVAYYTEGANFSNKGIGAIGRRAAADNHADRLWAAIFAIAIVGVGGLQLLALLERTLLHWHAAQRTESV
ncbi:MAG: ABC transporter permease subunit [Actinobacteria bacterium]|nr:ABC transporter permease subunit [Actinomycetota bacterium]